MDSKAIEQNITVLKADIATVDAKIAHHQKRMLVYQQKKASLWRSLVMNQDHLSAARLADEIKRVSIEDKKEMKESMALPVLAPFEFPSPDHENVKILLEAADELRSKAGV